jgi:Domain of unknown function (DUF4391)
MTEALYRWPAAAAFGRVVPKTKFYEHATVSVRVREKFVSEVQRITWAYKLAEETIRLVGDSGVPEIQVFTIDAKGQDISNDVLATIDKAVQTPVIFEINRDTKGQPQSRMTAAQKALGGIALRLTSYFTTSWLPARTPRVPIPPALDLPGLYAQLLTPLLPIAPRPGESVAAATQRVSQARKIEREIATLEKRIRNEPQFNRKVELRRQLRERTAALAALTDPARPTTEDGPWTS